MDPGAAQHDEARLIHRTVHLNDIGLLLVDPPPLNCDDVSILYGWIGIGHPANRGDDGCYRSCTEVRSGRGNLNFLAGTRSEPSSQFDEVAQLHAFTSRIDRWSYHFSLNLDNMFRGKSCLVGAIHGQ